MYAVWVFVSQDLDLSCLENGNIEKIIEKNIKVELLTSLILNLILLFNIFSQLYSKPATSS
jgi:hypothetical protein